MFTELCEQLARSIADGLQLFGYLFALTEPFIGFALRSPQDPPEILGEVDQPLVDVDTVRSRTVPLPFRLCH
jgi:hypothetical protein